MGLEGLEIAADGDRLGNDRTVVEHQSRHPLQGIDGGIGLRALLQFTEVDRLRWNGDAFLSQKNTPPPRVWRPATVIELHCSRLPIPLTARPYRPHPRASSADRTQPCPPI